MDPLNPSEQELNAQAYRDLRTVIEQTMEDQSRWDGDDAEHVILGRYVQWLAGEVERLGTVVRDVGEVHREDRNNRGHCGVCADHKGEAARWPCETADMVLADVEGVAVQPDTVTVTMTREDAQELTVILLGDRVRMDKGDGNVPQPRWGANVRVAQAVHAAVDALAPKEG